MMPVGDLVMTEQLGDLVEDRKGFARSRLRYWLPLPISSVVAKEQDVVDTGCSMMISFSVSDLLIWDMDGMYGAMKGPLRYSGAVSTIELDDFIQEFDTWCDMQFLN